MIEGKVSMRDDSYKELTSYLVWLRDLGMAWMIASY